MRFYNYPKPPNKKKNEWGEYVIKAYDDQGKRVPEKDHLDEDFNEITSRYANYLGGKYFSNRDKEIKP